MTNTFQQRQRLQAQATDADATAPAAAWTPTRVLIAIGAAGPLIFLAVAALAAFVTPGYNAFNQAASELAVGPRGWLMTANFFGFGLAILAFAVGLFRGLRRPSYVGTALLGVAGAGIFASGLYPTDLRGAPVTDADTMHNNLFLVVFLAMLVSYAFNAFALRREPGWRGYPRYTALTGPVVFALLAAFVLVGSDPGDPLFAVGGLIQRTLLLVTFGWMTVVGRRLLSGKRGL